MGGRYSKGERGPDGGFTPGSEEHWTPELLEDIFTKLVDFLWKNEDICFMGELSIKAERAQIIKKIELHYLLYNRDLPENANNILNEINTILEFRCAKTKDMYPQIAVLALKNKHKWTDRTELDQNVKSEGFKIIRADESQT